MGTGTPSPKAIPFSADPEGQSSSFLMPSSLLTCLPWAASFHPALLSHFCCAGGQVPASSFCLVWVGSRGCCSPQG